MAHGLGSYSGLGKDVTLGSLSRGVVQQRVGADEARLDGASQLNAVLGRTLMN